MVTVSLPALPTGLSYENIAVTPTRESVYVFTAYIIDGNTHLIGQPQWVTESMLSTLTATFTTALDANGDTVLSIAFANWDTMREWEWRYFANVDGNAGTFQTMSSTYLSPIDLTTTSFYNDQQQSYVTVLRQLRARRLQYDVSFDIVTGLPGGTFILENTPSLGAWGLREAKFPDWFSSSAQASVQARIDELAQPRHLHTVDFPALATRRRKIQGHRQA